MADAMGRMTSKDKLKMIFPMFKLNTYLSYYSLTGYLLRRYCNILI